MAFHYTFSGLDAEQFSVVNIVFIFYDVKTSFAERDDIRFEIFFRHAFYDLPTRWNTCEFTYNRLPQERENVSLKYRYTIRIRF